MEESDGKDEDEDSPSKVDKKNEDVSKEKRSRKHKHKKHSKSKKKHRKRKHKSRSRSESRSRSRSRSNEKEHSLKQSKRRSLSSSSRSKSQTPEEIEHDFVLEKEKIVGMEGEDNKLKSDTEDDDFYGADRTICLSKAASEEKPHCDQVVCESKTLDSKGIELESSTPNVSSEKIIVGSLNTTSTSAKEEKDRSRSRSHSEGKVNDSERKKSASNSRSRSKSPDAKSSRKSKKRHSRSSSKDRKTKRKSRSLSSSKKKSRSRSRSKNKSSKRKSKSRPNFRRFSNPRWRRGVGSFRRRWSRSRSRSRRSRSRRRSSSRRRQSRSRSRGRRSCSRSRSRLRNRRSQSVSRDRRRKRSASRDKRKSKSRSRSKSKEKTQASNTLPTPSVAVVNKALVAGVIDKPVAGADISTQQVKVAQRAGGKTIAELTAFCKKLQEDKESAVNNGAGAAVETEEEDFQPVAHHPFLVREKPDITIPAVIFPVNRQPMLPSVDPSKPLQEQFPVSCGSKHREKETVNDGAGIVADVDGSAIQTQPKVAVFAQPPAEKFDISELVAKRMDSQRRLQSDPNDIEALLTLQEIQMKMQNWCQSNVKPGQFTGELVKNLLPRKICKEASKRGSKSGGIGMKLLQKMGWKPGQVIGKRGEGYAEPIAVTIKIDRKGLSAGKEKATKKGAPGMLDLQGML
ncbi:hypothetical protein OS493_009758 [Desmophyllum pertusum]|uniref:G-patch domain-containing protein n=1 Tax=Desmophyllum pertusum TaxID=174260 RepID=A0A9W9YRG1_9CNID|nr:hypothetical protein OS493_009758 [Desmophyllum pertusum]